MERIGRQADVALEQHELRAVRLGDDDEGRRRIRRPEARGDRPGAQDPHPPTIAPPRAIARLKPLTRVVAQPLHRALGLTDGELDRIRELMEREPNHFELAVFSLLWSEHCGYKHSALLLRRFSSEGERVLQGPGENAGVLDLGDGE